MELRDYQQQAIDDVLSTIKNHKKIKTVVVQPCGAGKSLIIAKLCEVIKKPILVLQPSKELLEQNYGKFRMFGGEAAIFSASVGIKEIDDVTYATPMSVKKMGKEFKKLGVKTVVIDECHHSSKTNGAISKLLKQIDPNHVIGLTATPLNLHTNLESGTTLRMINEYHKSIFNHICHITQTGDIVEKGFWSPVQIEVIQQDQDKLKLNTQGTDFTLDSMLEFYDDNKLSEQILQQFEEGLQKGRKHCLIFTPSIERADDLAKKDKRIKVVSANTPKTERQQILEDFKSGVIKGVATVDAIATGFDFPELDFIVMARPTNSYVIYYQQCLDESTEVLTKEGFKKVDEVSVGDHVYGFDQSNLSVVDNEIKEVIKRKQYDGERIVSFENHSGNFRVSEYHEMLYSHKGNKNKSCLKTECRNLLDKKSLMFLPNSGFEDVPDCGLKEHELEFLGWFLSDGYYNKSNNTVVISQSSKSDYLDRLLYILDKCNFKYTKSINKRNNPKYSDGFNFTISYTTREVGKRGWKDLEDFIDKNMNNNYNLFSREDCIHLLRGIIYGDGCTKKITSYNVKTHRINMGTDKKYADNFQSLFVRRGFQTTLRETTGKYSEGFNHNPGTISYMIHIKDSRYFSVPGINVEDGQIGNKNPYKRSRMEVEDTKDENLWCINTKQGNIITRRNGKIVIMGNCGRGVRIHPDKKDLLLVDLVGNTTKFGRPEEMTYEYVEDYGWGMFLGEYLMTKVNLKNGLKVKKEHLLQGVQTSKKSVVVGQDELWFGKHKGKKVSEIPHGYLDWMLSQKDFNWAGEKNKKKIESFKNACLIELGKAPKKDTPVQSWKRQPRTDRELVESFQPEKQEDILW